MPSSSIHTPLGTFTNPNNSSVTCAESMSDGCAAAAFSMYGRAASGSTSSATVTISTPCGAHRSRNSFHSGRSKRHPHHDAHEVRTTFLPRRLESVNTVAVGVRQLGARARRPSSAPGPSPRSPGRAPKGRGPRRPRSAYRAGPRSRAASRRPSSRRASAGSGTHTSPLHAPSGLIAQPVRASNTSSATVRSSKITARR